MADSTVLFLPGLNCTAALFGRQLDVLGCGHAMHVADHRSDSTIEAIAARALAAAPARFALCGLSMGGYIAFEIMKQAPERVTRLALLDTRCEGAVPAEEPGRIKLVDLARAGRYDDVHDILWRRLVHPDRRSDRALEDIVRQMMMDTGAEAFARQQNALMHRADYKYLLPGINVPTLVLVGAQDALTPPSYSQEMAEGIRNSRLVMVPDCGHLSTLERPEAVNAALTEWLAM